MYPKKIQDLIEDFSRLPGIGNKAAERIVMHLLSINDNNFVRNFSENLKNIYLDIKKCSNCFMYTDQELCFICLDQTRDQTIIMVVADAKDLIMIEKTKSYHGLYHVLGGLIDYTKGIDEEKLTINNLSKRLINVQELIIATNATVEGEITALFLANFFQNTLVTRIAYGLPFGADFKYTDDKTIKIAVNNRRKVS